MAELMKFEKYHSESCLRYLGGTMNLSYTDEQNMLRDMVSKFCTTDYDFETRMKTVNSDNGSNPEHWKCLLNLVACNTFSEEQVV